IKFCKDFYLIDKACSENLRRKVSTFQLATNTNKSVRLTMITVYGVKYNKYSSIVNSQITAEDLFKDDN
ncbi:MAG: ATP-binding protein, partial [Bacteroidales bacterium]|nr:ATP-binding protein [Bacteroidales bacterium]